jgi:hypothetical protein
MKQTGTLKKWVETDQFYQALKLRGVDTVMVRFPNAPLAHDCQSRKYPVLVPEIRP